MSTTDVLTPEMKELIRQEVQREISKFLKPQLLSLNEAAKRLKMGITEFKTDFLSTGKIPFVKITIGSKVIRRISEDSIHEFIQQNKFEYRND